MRRKDVLLQVLRIFIGEAICIAIMILFYSLLNKLDASVLLGALVGGILAIGNFFFLSIAVSKAADRAAESGSEKEAAKAAISVQRSAVVRMLVLLALYFLLLKSGRFNPIATVLPLIFVQLSIYVTEFFRKDGEKSA